MTRMSWQTRRLLINSQISAAQRYEDARLMYELAQRVSDCWVIVAERQALAARWSRDTRNMYATEKDFQ